MSHLDGRELSRPSIRAAFLSASVADKTNERYVKAAENFLLWAKTLTDEEPETYRELDILITDYIIFHFYENSRRGHRQEMIDTKAGVELFLGIPSRQLPMTSRALKSWDRLIPGKSPPPLTRELLFVIARHLRKKGEMRLACGLIVTFCAYLRINEVLSLKPCDSDVSDRAGIRVDIAKTGRNQFVSFDEGFGLHALRWLKVNSLEGEKMVGVSYWRIRRAFMETLEELGLDHLGFTLHSLRHGGATHDFTQGIDLKLIALRGRWESEKNLRRYIQSGRASLVGLELPLEVQNIISLIRIADTEVLGY
eukprot:Lithocolla_globosa_v1_NODE_182_length_5436_cov_23.147742.p2 type:complete len:309 gc:universal NODE_182_length_5436_cov_23.147742:3369-4295(+)